MSVESAGREIGIQSVCNGPGAAVAMRAVSLLPSATELLVAVAGEDVLVGRSHECDYPPSIQDRPPLTAAKTAFVDSQQMHDAGERLPPLPAAATPVGGQCLPLVYAAADAAAAACHAVCSSLAAGEGLYALDSRRLASLAPDVVVTQSLCRWHPRSYDACAPATIDSGLGMGCTAARMPLPPPPRPPPTRPRRCAVRSLPRGQAEQRRRRRRLSAAAACALWTSAWCATRWPPLTRLRASSA